jgi:hypothetical protein
MSAPGNPIPWWVPADKADAYLAGQFTVSDVAEPYTQSGGSLQQALSDAFGNAQPAGDTTSQQQSTVSTITQGALNAVIPGLGDAVTGLAGTASTAASATSAAFSFITDIPRVATTVVGIILIIAGIFALSRGPAVEIATDAVKAAATS